MFLSMSNSRSKLPILLSLFPFLFAAKCRKGEEKPVEDNTSTELKQDIFQASSPELTVQVLGMEPDTVELGQAFQANIFSLFS